MSMQLVDEFEAAFQSCISALTNASSNQVHDSEGTKNDAELNIERFIDLGRQVEAALLQKRLMLSVQKPEQVLMEEKNELRFELQRKEALLQRVTSKIPEWQVLLSEKGPQIVSRPPPLFPAQGVLPQMTTQGIGQPGAPPPPNMAMPSLMRRELPSGQFVPGQAPPFIPPPGPAGPIYTLNHPRPPH